MKSWEHLAFACYLKGDQEGIRAASAGLWAIIATTPQPHDEACALFPLCLVDGVVAPERVEAIRSRLELLSHELDSPFIDLLASTAIVVDAVLRQDPITAASRAGAALELAEQLESRLPFGDNIRGVIGVAMVGTGSPETSAMFERDLAAFYEQRDWAVIWWTLEAVVCTGSGPERSRPGLFYSATSRPAATTRELRSETRTKCSKSSTAVPSYICSWSSERP